MRGIEPPSQAWEACVLPLNHIRRGDPKVSPRALRDSSNPSARGRSRPVVGSPGMILSDRSIREEIALGRVEIDPYDEACVQPSSVDLRVDRRFRTFHNARYPFIDVKKEMAGLTELVEVEGEEPFILHPGEFVLGSTLERVRLPDDLVARLEGKSSLGRLGLLIHSTAGYVDPGWDGYLTLELSNVANLPITIYPGMKIGQISFFRLSTAAERPYGSQDSGSKYQGQRGPTASRFYEEFAVESGPPGQL
jgi:dCTP deaminase